MNHESKQEGQHNTTIGVGMKTFTRNAVLLSEQKDNRTLVLLFPPQRGRADEFNYCPHK